MTTEPKKDLPVRRRDVVQLLLLLAPPAIWALQQQASYALAASACEARAQWWLHLISAVALAAVAAATLLSWTAWKRLPEGSTDHGEPEATRQRFMALSAVWLGVFFVVVIVATELPNWFLGACE